MASWHRISLLAFSLCLAAGAVSAAWAPLWCLPTALVLIAALFAWRNGVVLNVQLAVYWLAYVVGAVLFAFTVNAKQAQMLSAQCDGMVVTADFTLKATPERSLAGAQTQQRLWLRSDDAQLAACFQRLPVTLRLSWWRAEPALAAGDEIRATVKLRRPHGSRNPGGFDYVAWLWRKDTHATGYIKHIEQPQSAPTTTLRERLRTTLEQQLAGHPAKPLVMALALAQRNGLSAEQWQQARETGVAHLLAISGLHLGLVAAAVFLLARLFMGFWGRLRTVEKGVQPIFVMLPVMLVTAFYAYLAGWPLSAQRAWLMLAVFAISTCLNWRLPRFQAWALALLLCVVWQPLNVLDAGFYLSFAAVALLLWIVPTREGHGGHLLQRLVGEFIKLLRIQLGLLLGMLPLQLWFFGGFSLAALPFNLLLVPVVALLLLPALLLVCLGLLLNISLAEPALLLLAEGFDSFQQVMAWGHRQISGTVLGWQRVGAPNIAQSLLLLLALLCCLLPKAMALRYLGVLGLAAFMAALLWPLPDLRQGEFRITAFDAGQGTALLLQTAEHNIVYDTGADWRGGGSAMQTMVLPSLAHLGVASVDWVIISHADNDHAGGLPSLLKQYPQAQVVGGDIRPCGVGFELALDAVTITALWPLSGANLENDQSCVVRVDGLYGSALLTGDIGTKAEAALVTAGADLTADWLLVPHHGSKTSSSEAFLKAVRPSVAVITSGHNNRYGLPAQTVLQRYAQWLPNTKLLNTAWHGAVSTEFKQGCVACVSSQSQHLRWWQQVAP